ncbi:histidine phosphatase family protein [Streptomyces cyanogenus]|uniref:Bifunctional RNase H/acid phosphatase n=1 Tax=Streptomyces cyanogenus TaxID=80860 RepID=A0ABX7TK93_STRCY|nr:histidine phosphatase family protein [Streptomyces cyanogenus]QTD97115.1 bifunctional RNase H/acid phosphatase [Streptomyces cyanogenus]
MTVRLTMLCATAADGGHDRVFGDGAPGPSVTAALAPYALALRGPSARCARTAEALGIDATPEPALRDLDHGAWEGRSRAGIAAEDPHGLSVWLTDPDAAPHGGESVRRLCRRTADWLSALPAGTGPLLVIADESVVRAALVHALSLPARSFRHLEVPSAVTLTLRDGRWNVRLGAPTIPRRGQPADGSGTVAVLTMPAIRRHLCLSGRP